MKKGDKIRLKGGAEGDRKRIEDRDRSRGAINPKKVLIWFRFKFWAQGVYLQAPMSSKHPQSGSFQAPIFSSKVNVQVSDMTRVRAGLVCEKMYTNFRGISQTKEIKL